MLNPDDIQRLCERKYSAFLRSLVAASSFFPLEIRFGKPSTTDEWEKLRREISQLAIATIGYRIEWSETSTRKWGKQRFPERVWFESEVEYLGALRKQREVDRFRQNLALTRKLCPQLEEWLQPHATQVIEFDAVWQGLLDVCCYFLKHPLPGLYARELPVPIHTKFIEEHRGILRSLLDHLLPPTAKVDADRFEERFGLRFDEAVVRLRTLDPSNSPFGVHFTDISVPVSELRRTNWHDFTVVVAENKMNFLTLPPVSRGIGIWGGGGAAELLTSLDWLAQCQVFYWGDIDIHGFHILSRLRRCFPQTVSVMMDERTLDEFRHVAVVAKPSPHENVSGLTPSERVAYARVRDGVLLLEQERIPPTVANARLMEAIVRAASEK